jgi:DNA polymerase I-like protein with 3'-5' exonuclease and polymerase domains
MAKGFNKKYQQMAQAGQMPLLVPESNWTIPSELPDLRNRPILACDTETKDDGLANGRGPGWVYRQGHICGVVLAADDVSVYAPVRHPEGDCFDEDAVRRWTNDHMRAGKPVVFQNAPYDLGWLGNWEIKPPDILEDTMGMANVLDENRFEYNLDSLCKWQGIPGKDEEKLREAASCYGVDPKSGLWRLPARYVAPYGQQDGSSTLGLFHKFKALLIKDDLWEAYRLEADIIPLVVEMRRRGIRIDGKQAEIVKRQFQEHREKILAELSRRCGTKVTMKDVKSDLWLVHGVRRGGHPGSQIAEWEIQLRLRVDVQA